MVWKPADAESLIQPTMGKRIAIASVVLTILSLSLITHAADAPERIHRTQAASLHQEAPYAILSGAALERTIIANLNSSDASAILDVWVTAYTSDPAETDDTPFITASGSLVREGVAAANFLPIGTEFRVPERFGDKVFVVEDRMNARYNNQHIVDLWFQDKDSAIKFGKRYLTIEIL